MKSLIALLLLVLTSPAYATWALVNYSGNQGMTSGTTVTLTAPASYASGNLLVCAISHDGSTQPAVPTGWTSLYADAITNGDGQFGTIGYKIAAGGDSFVFTNMSSGEGYSYGCAAFSQSSGTPAFDVGSNTNPNSVTVPISPISVTGSSITTTAADVIVVFDLVDQNLTPSEGNWTFSTPTGFTALQQNIGGSASNSPSGMFYEIQSSSGSTGSIVSTATSSATGEGGNYISFVAAFKSSGGSITDSCSTQAGAITVPTAGSTSCALKSGAFGTVDGSTISYRCPTQGNFCLN